MKLPYAKGFPLRAALLTVSPCGACVFAPSMEMEDEAVVQEVGHGPTGITLTEKD
jgi:hypothetical protein